MKKPTTPFDCVAVEFHKTPKAYFYLAPKSMGLKKGDRVIVRNKESFSIPTVAAVDETCEQLDMSLVSDWIVQKIDTGAYQALVEETKDE